MADINVLIAGSTIVCHLSLFKGLAGQDPIDAVSLRVDASSSASLKAYKVLNT